ncbi:hypothetical protein LSAT2_025913 [Lamellibrachia satsuma]|nr:hypothetical protein LSAT2_025913 [Lamellibrachia satsuma]
MCVVLLTNREGGRDDMCVILLTNRETGRDDMCVVLLTNREGGRDDMCVVLLTNREGRRDDTCVVLLTNREKNMVSFSSQRNVTSEKIKQCFTSSAATQWNIWPPSWTGQRRAPAKLQHFVSEANEICVKQQKKTISPEHVLIALENLGFGSYTADARAVLQQTKATAAKKRKASTKLENLGIPEEELFRLQQELFAKARLEQQQLEQQEWLRVQQAAQQAQQQQQQAQLLQSSNTADNNDDDNYN